MPSPLPYMEAWEMRIYVEPQYYEAGPTVSVPFCTEVDVGDASVAAHHVGTFHVQWGRVWLVGYPFPTHYQALDGTFYGPFCFEGTLNGYLIFHGVGVFIGDSH